MSLSPDRERLLIQQAQTEPKSREELLNAHRKNVRWMAKRFVVSGILDEQDLYNTGVVGFQEAVTRFHPSYNNRLWTYACYWVERRLIELCCEKLHLSDDARRHFKRILATQNALRHEQHREPTAEEVATVSGVHLTAVQEVLQPWAGRESPIVNDEDEREELPTGVVVAVPAISEELVSHYQTVIQCLGSKEGPKWLILFQLHECESMEWREIAQYLAQPTAHIAPSWIQLCAQSSLPSVIPRDWSKIGCLFQTPPPMLTSNNLEQNAQNLRQYYRRGRARLRSQWPDE